MTTRYMRSNPDHQYISKRHSVTYLELWTIFHDELDLDGNGHLDAGELAIALSHAGMIHMLDSRRNS